MMLLWVASALAGSFIVAIREDGGAFSGAVPRVTVTDAAGNAARIDMQDGGTTVDKRAGDAVWTGDSGSVGAGPYTLLITDGGDVRVWKGSFAAAGTDPVVLRVSAQTGGVLTELGEHDVAVGDAPPVSPTSEAPSANPAPPGEPMADGTGAPAGAPQPTGDGGQGGGGNAGGGGGGGGGNAGGGAPNAGPGDAGPSGGVSAVTTDVGSFFEELLSSDPFQALGAGPRAGAWALVIGVFAWVLAGARRFSAAAIDALPGPLPPVAVRGVVPMDGEWDAFVRTLAGPFRVILVGAGNPGVVPGGTVFPLGTGRVPVDDVVALYAHLTPTGPPIAVVIVGGLVGDDGPGDQAAVELLGTRLPKDAVAYVFASAASRRSSSASAS